MNGNRNGTFCQRRPGYLLLGTLVAALWLGSGVHRINGQSSIELPTTEPAPSTGDEYDTWRSSSLGIRVDHRDAKVFVETVHDFVAGTNPLQAGDELISIAGVPVKSLAMDKVSELLEQTPPATILTAQIKRDDLLMELPVKTVRHQLVDVADIVSRLRRNDIINAHLKDTGRPEFLDAASQRMINAVLASRSPREAYEGINQVIDEIGVSHTAFVPRRSLGALRGSDSGTLGLTLQRHTIGDRAGYFVIDMMPGTAGAKSEIKLGDEILFLNGVAINYSRRLVLAGKEQRHGVFFIRAEMDETVRIEYRRRQNGGMQTTRIMAGAGGDANDVLRYSARILPSGENRIGYVRFWNLMSIKTPANFHNLTKSKFQNCHALLIDLRGRGGLIPVVLGLDRAIQKVNVPVIAITDNLTRSAKEMLALRIKQHKHVTVIGETTAGAVTGATYITLPSGNALMFPAASGEMLKRFTGGVILEGHGVEPDISLDFQIPYCSGNDRLLEAAIEVANEQIQELLDSLILP